MRLLAFLVPLVLAACPSPPRVTPCNFDDDCARPAFCIEGICAERPVAGEGEEGEGEEGEGEEGEGEKGEGEEGEGEGEGEEGCPPDTHDGGDGTCVPLGTCSVGFARFFSDGDLDGHGDGALLDDCRSDPPPPGFSAVSDDCAPGDANAFVFGDFFPDLDDDGFTAPVVSSCGNGAPPLLHRATAQRAPILAALPQGADGNSGPESDWIGPHDSDRIDGDLATVDVDPGESGDFLALSDFVCGVAPTSFDGLEVRAVDASVNAGGDQEIELRVALVEGGAEVAALARTDDWPPEAQATTYVLGGPADTWLGTVGTFDPCASSFELRTTLEPTSFNGEAGLDAIIVLVYGVDDCDDEDAQVSSPAVIYDDDDGDLYGEGSGTSGCFSLAEVLASAHRATDCNDNDGDAFPFQNARFTSPANGSGGSFDYDCNDAEDPNTISSALTCVDVGGTCEVATSTDLSGNCGQIINAQECVGVPPCVLTPTAATERIGCR